LSCPPCAMLEFVITEFSFLPLDIQVYRE
jgi:hypothetical protein